MNLKTIWLIGPELSHRQSMFNFAFWFFYDDGSCRGVLEGGNKVDCLKVISYMFKNEITFFEAAVRILVRESVSLMIVYYRCVSLVIRKHSYNKGLS